MAHVRSMNNQIWTCDLIGRYYNIIQYIQINLNILNNNNNMFDK
jgi:hypothetical protein